MDFARINPQKEAEIGTDWHVDYDGEELFLDGEPITIGFIGVDSELGRKESARMVKRLDVLKRSKSKKKDGNIAVKDLSVTDILALADGNEEIKAKFYASLTTGWSNVTYIPDDMLDDPDAVAEELEYSKANAEMLFTTRPWMMKGIDAFLG